jgi:hypothetical protein
MVAEMAADAKIRSVGEAAANVAAALAVLETEPAVAAAPGPCPLPPGGCRHGVLVQIHM